MHLPPFNISIIDPEEYILRKGALPVSSHSIFETNTHRFHPEGFFSEAIFGQIGSRDRLIKKGYLDLKTYIINPHLFRQLVTLKGFYQDVLASKVYAYYSPELSDLVKTTADDPRGRTGYSYFLDILPSLKFAETDSLKRSDKIKLLEKYSDRLLITKYIVIPAGLRDIRETDGRVAPEEINKLYFALLSLTQALPDNLATDPIYDGIRYKIQMTVQEIYDYIANLIDGKGGFASSKYTARAVVYSNRNVITAAPLTKVMSPSAPNMFHEDEVQVPLFQGMKGCMPLMVNRLKHVFFDQIFSNQTNSVPLIDPDTLSLVYGTVNTSTIQRFTSSDGINDLVNDFRNVELQKEPVTVKAVVEGEKEKEYYLYLVYDNDDEIYTLRNVDDLKHTKEDYTRIDTSNIETLKLLEELNPQDYVIMGSTALHILGMDNDPQDIDILASPTLFETIKQDPEWKHLDYGAWRKELEGGKHIDVYNDMMKDVTDFDTVKIGPYSIQKPEQIYAFYLQAQRAKDRRKIEFLKHNWIFERKRIRPMTWVELFYIAAQDALKDKYGTATRHPVLLIENIQCYKIHLMSTTPSRVVKLKSFAQEALGDKTREIILPEYPLLDQQIKTSMSVSPCTLAAYDGNWSPSCDIDLVAA